MRKKIFLRELMLPAFWVVVFIVSGQRYEDSKTGTMVTTSGNSITPYSKKMTNYTKSQARYLWFYILPDISGNRMLKQII